jgi:hypothetical protein
MKSWKNACPSDLKLYEGICKVFAKHMYLLEGFFEETQVRLSSTPEIMIERAAGYSHGEIVLIKVALDMWSGSGNVFVWQILETLDQQTFLSVIEGLKFVKHEQQTLFGPLGGFS